MPVVSRRLWMPACAGMTRVEKASLRDGRKAGVAIQSLCQVWIASLLRASQ
jgi:hypothetical protein